MDKYDLSKQFSNTSQDIISRAALILYSELIINNKHKIYLLLPTSSVTGCITTLGGRKTDKRETDIECVIREAREESRGILNYGEIPEIFTTKNFTKLLYKECAYFIGQIPFQELKKIQKLFDATEQVNTEFDEISKLNYYDIDKLIFDLNCEKSFYKYHPSFSDMFLSVGYDFLKKITCNRETRKLGIEGKIYTKISSLPEYVSLQPLLISDAPKLYGEVICANNLFYIYDQYYGKFGGVNLFRNSKK